MADRDKYGNYINDKGVTIKINTDKNGNNYINFYGGEVDKPHDAAHVNIMGLIRVIQIQNLVVAI